MSESTRTVVAIAASVLLSACAGSPGSTPTGPSSPVSVSGSLFVTGSAMLQALLVERFAFKFHRETREIDGFALVRTTRDRLGPQLRVSQFDCEKAFVTTPACREGRIGTEHIQLVSNRLAMAPGTGLAGLIGARWAGWARWAGYAGWGRTIQE